MQKMGEAVLTLASSSLPRKVLRGPRFRARSPGHEPDLADTTSQFDNAEFSDCIGRDTLNAV